MKIVSFTKPSQGFYPTVDGSEFRVRLAEEITTQNSEIGLLEFGFMLKGSEYAFEVGVDASPIWANYYDTEKTIPFDSYYPFPGVYRDWNHFVTQVGERAGELPGVTYSAGARKITVNQGFSVPHFHLTAKPEGREPSFFEKHALKGGVKRTNWFGQLLYDIKLTTARPPPSKARPAFVFVYCDLMRPQPLGDVIAQCLRTIAVPIKNGLYEEQRHYYFDKPFFYPMMSDSVHEFSIALKNERGEDIHFESDSIYGSFGIRPADSPL